MVVKGRMNYDKTKNQDPGSGHSMSTSSLVFFHAYATSNAPSILQCHYAVPSVVMHMSAGC